MSRSNSGPAGAMRPGPFSFPVAGAIMRAAGGIRGCIAARETRQTNGTTGEITVTGGAADSAWIAPVRIREAARAKTRAALGSGALVPLATEVSRVEEQGVSFVVRIAGEWRRKPRAASRDMDGAVTARGEGPEHDPFLPPYEPDLYVGDLTPTHTLLLNKYPVLGEHLLLVTRHYERQTAPMTEADFHALLTGLAGVDGLAFYNAGRVAGASQPHRHIQLVPLPLDDTDAAGGAGTLPVRPWWDAVRFTGDVGHNPALPFRHAVAPVPAAWLDDPLRGASAMADRVAQCWRLIGNDGSHTVSTPPGYNLLATREWMWLVPRQREGGAGLSVNALGFAGCFLVGDHERYAELRRLGPLNLLAQV